MRSKESAHEKETDRFPPAGGRDPGRRPDRLRKSQGRADAPAARDGPYDPMDRVMEDRLNAILEAAVAQDAAAVKAQFAPNAIAAQPELDSQIEALLAYYNNETWEFEIPATGISESRNETGGTTRSYEMHSRIDGEKYYLVAMHAVVNDTTEPDNVGIWSLFLFRTDYPIESAYYVKDEDNMVGIYVDLLPRHMQY